MTRCASKSCQGASHAFQARPLGGIVGQISLLFPILDGIEFRGTAAGVDEDVILIDHGIDRDHLIANENGDITSIDKSQRPLGFRPQFPPIPAVGSGVSTHCLPAQPAPEKDGGFELVKVPVAMGTARPKFHVSASRRMKRGDRPKPTISNLTLCPPLAPKFRRV
jgi:hypothetical protein